MSVAEVVAAAAAPSQQKLLLPRWVTTTVVGVISLQLIVRASCALYRRRLMVAQSDALRVNHSSPKSSDAVVVQGGSAPASSDNSAHEGLASIGALCAVVVKHMAEVQGDALHRDEMGRGEEVVEWRAWALATEAACLHGLDVKKDESSNIYRGSFHAVDDEILELVRDARFLLSAPITTPSAVGYRCLLLIARRERLLRIRAAIEVLRDARQSADALESWVELHDTVGLRSLHEAWPSTSHPEQTPMSDVIHRLQTIWELQQRQHAALLAQHRRLRWVGSVTLVRLIVAASPVKIALLLSAGVCGLVIAWLSGKGNAIRDLCEQQTAEFLVAGHAQWNPTVVRDFAVRLCPLVGKELIRILAEQFLNTYLVTQIKLWSARQREVMKMQTLRCLIDQPLSFYHIYGQDEIDEIVLYVNDIEGVDVHVHQFLLKIQLSVLKLHDTARKASWFILIAAACGVAMHQATIVTCEVLRVGWRMLTMAAFRTYTDKPIDDLEELENAASGTRQVLLGGGAIISEVHRLRPHDADHRLMERWCDSMTSAAEQFRHGNVRRVVGDARMPRNGWMRLFVSSSISIVDGLPDTVDSALASIPAFVRWVIPMVLACCVTPFVSSRMAPKWAAKTTKGVRGVTVISDTMTLVEAVVTATVDVVRIYDLIIANGHKALMVQRFMKRAEREKERRLATTVDRRVVDDVLSGITPIRAIHFRDVNFVYPRPQAFTPFAYESGETSQSQLVLNRLNVSLTDLPGKLVCITGPSGCGKSTMLNLLLGLYRSSEENVELSGNIMLEIESHHHHQEEGQAVATTDETTSSPPHDVVNLESLSSSTIRGVGGIFGFVPQQASVFPGTIAQNVALLQSVSLSTDQNELQRVKKACEQANCMNYITKLSDGVMSYVVPPSSSGASSAAGLQATSTVLSVGQAQRLMIARALYQGCCILLMDEPTSALDQSTKATLLNDLKSALKQPGQLQTIIAVTHDEAVVATADVVVVVG